MNKSLPTAASQPKTIHEVISKKLKKTSKGSLFAKDISDIFSILIICLKLENSSPAKFKINPLASKTYPFGFQIDEALTTLQDLKLDIELVETTTTVSYSIKPDLGLFLLGKFMENRLLHTPADRTRRRPQVGVALQPTAKGVAVIQNFCGKIGLRGSKLPSILNTNFNSLELFNFDRNPISDSIVYSDYLIHLLFIRLMGPSPNVWSPQNEPDPLPLLNNKLETDEIFDFSIFPGTRDEPHFEKLSNQKISKEGISGLLDQSISPFHHRFFTNPESDAHSQYYVSDRGVRILLNKYDHTTKSLANYGVSGKSICQWLIDCTDSNMHEVNAIASLFLEKELIKPIGSFSTHSNKFINSRNVQYRLTPLGQRVVHWSSKDETRGIETRDMKKFPRQRNKRFSESSGSVLSNEETSSNNSLKITLRDVLADPGTRYLFRTHLEKEFCVENFNVYFSIKQFEKNFDILRNLLSTKQDTRSELEEKELESLNENITKMANNCLSTGYHIYFTYITKDSPAELNIDFGLRENISRLMMHPQCGLSEKHFAMDLKTPKIEDPLSFFDGEDYFENSSTPKEKYPPLPSSIVCPETIPVSPSTESIFNTLEVLRNIKPHLKLIRKRVYRLMEVDSFPKFIKGEVFKEISTTIIPVEEIDKKST